MVVLKSTRVCLSGCQSYTRGGIYILFISGFFPINQEKAEKAHRNANRKGLVGTGAALSNTPIFVRVPGILTHLFPTGTLLLGFQGLLVLRTFRPAGRSRWMEPDVIAFRA